MKCRFIAIILSALLLTACGAQADVPNENESAPDAADITSAAPEAEDIEDDAPADICIPGMPHIHAEAEEIKAVYDHYLSYGEKTVSGEALAELVKWFDGLEYHHVEPEEIEPVEGGGSYIFSYPDIECEGFIYSDAGCLIFGGEYYKVDNPSRPLSVFPETFGEIKTALENIDDYEKGLLVSYSEPHNGNWQETYIGDAVVKWLSELEVEPCGDLGDFTGEGMVYTHLTWFNYNYLNLFYVETGGEVYIVDGKSLWYRIIEPSPIPVDGETAFSEFGNSEGEIVNED